MSIKYYKKAMLYKDSLEQNEKRIEVLRLDKIYKTEKIKEENYILRLSQLKRKQIAYGFIALLFLSIGVFVWVYYKMKLEREAKIKKQMIILNQEKTRCYQLELERLQVSIRPRACFFPLFSFLPLWLHYNLNPLCVQY